MMNLNNTRVVGSCYFFDYKYRYFYSPYFYIYYFIINQFEYSYVLVVLYLRCILCTRIPYSNVLIVQYCELECASVRVVAVYSHRRYAVVFDVAVFLLTAASYIICNWNNLNNINCINFNSWLTQFQFTVYSTYNDIRQQQYVVVCVQLK